MKILKVDKDKVQVELTRGETKRLAHAIFVTSTDSYNTDAWRDSLKDLCDYHKLLEDK